MNISYTPGTPYRIPAVIAHLLMGQGVKKVYQDNAIKATKYQNSNYRSSQVWTLQALAFPRGTLRKGNVLRTPSDVYNGMQLFNKRVTNA